MRTAEQNISISRALGDAALKAYRQGWVRAFLPPSARRLLHAGASGLIKRSTGDLVDDWSRPLLGTGSRVAMPTTAPVPTEIVDPRSAGIHATEIDHPPDAPRCLLATSSLGANGMDESGGVSCAKPTITRAPDSGSPQPRKVRQDVTGHLARMLPAAGIEVVVAREGAARQWIREWGPDVISSHDTPDWVLDEARCHRRAVCRVLHGMNSLFDCDWTPKRSEVET